MNLRRQTLPAAQFYWAILDLEPAERARLNLDHASSSLEVALEPHLPVPIDDLFLTYQRLPDGDILACGIPREVLQDLPSTHLALSPDSVPTFLAERGVNTGALNFMTREYEPQFVRRARTNRTLAICGSMILATLLICLGWARRVSAARDFQRTSDAAIITHVAQVLGEDAPSSPQEALDSLDVALRHARTLASAGTASTSFDAAQACASVLKVWPVQEGVTVQSLSITADVVNVALDIRGDAQAFLRRLKAPDGWKLDEPRLVASQDASRVTLQFHPVKEGGTP